MTVTCTRVLGELQIVLKVHINKDVNNFVHHHQSVNLSSLFQRFEVKQGVQHIANI